MLFTIVISPNIFTELPENTDYQKPFCNSGIGLLRKVSNNCVILVDSEQEVKKEIIQAINKWPVKFRRPAKEILKNLQQKNRIVSTAKRYELCNACQNKHCQHCVGIKLAGLADVIFMTELCCQCIKEQNLTIRPIDVNESEISNFEKIREKSTSITLTNGEWNQDQFEDKILIPIFRYSKHLKIFDRMIGRATVNNNGIIPDHYKETIEWLLEIFMRETSGRNGRIFEIYCGFDTRFADSSQINQSKKALEQFAQRLDNKCNFSIKVNIKKEEGLNEEMEHDRYLITDQIGLHIGRGCDLLWTNRQMHNNGLNPNIDPRPVKGVTLSLITEPNKVERTVRKLTDL